MPYKKKPSKCQFCHSRITIEKYNFEKNGRKYHSCSACRWLYDTVRKEIERDRFPDIRRILSCAISDKKHCTICTHYRTNHPRSCRRGFNTGVGSDYNGYPFSYAYHGCTNFDKLKT